MFGFSKVRRFKIEGHQEIFSGLERHAERNTWILFLLSFPSTSQPAWCHESMSAPVRPSTQSMRPSTQSMRPSTQSVQKQASETCWMRRFEILKKPVVSKSQKMPIKHDKTIYKTMKSAPIYLIYLIFLKLSKTRTKRCRIFVNKPKLDKNVTFSLDFQVKASVSLVFFPTPEDSWRQPGSHGTGSNIAQRRSASVIPPAWRSQCLRPAPRSQGGLSVG